MSESNHVETAQRQPGLPGGRSYAIEILRDSWGWFLALGVLLIFVGTLAVGASLFTTLATVIAFGVLLLVGAGLQVVGAFFSRNWGGFFMHLLTGLLYLFVGLLMVGRPLEAAAAATLLIAAFFLVGGSFRIAVALTERFPSRGWVLLNGVVTLLLGILIFSKWPSSALWVIGLFVGIELLFCGWSWVMLALAARGLAAEED